MNHFTDPEFWNLYQKLGQSVQRLADRNFRQLCLDPNHPSLRLKPVGRYWSVRVGLHHRAVAVRDGDDLIWFWIGSHGDYDNLLRRG